MNMKKIMRRGGGVAILVLLILVMVFFEDSLGMMGMVYNGLSYGILVLFGAKIIADIYELIKETHIIVVSPITILMSILSIGGLLYGMQGLWDTGWDLMAGPATYVMKAGNISWDGKEPFFSLEDGEYATITTGYGEQTLKLNRYAKEVASAANKEDDIKIIYWEHSNRVYDVIKEERK